MQRPTGMNDTGEFSSRQQVVDYLTKYESRYTLPIQRPIRVERDTAVENGYEIRMDRGIWHTSVVVNTTGTASHPVLPPYPDLADYTGAQLHSAQYRSPDGMADQRVLIVGVAIQVFIFWPKSRGLPKPSGRRSPSQRSCPTRLTGGYYLAGQPSAIGRYRPEKYRHLPVIWVTL